MNKKINWKNEKRLIKDLKPYPGNPRKRDEKDISDLKKSIGKFSLADPFIINTDGTIIGGNFRYFILKNEGDDLELDVRVPDRKLSKKEADELNLRLNKNQGKWDEELLKDFGYELLEEVGWEEDELKFMEGMGDIEDFEIEEERFDVICIVPEESPRLKERVNIQCDIDSYKKVKEYIEKNGDSKILEKIYEII